MRPYLGHFEPRVHAPSDAAPVIICPGHRSLSRARQRSTLLQALHHAARRGLTVMIQHAVPPAGFGNEANDYIAPGGRQELGMVTHLQVSC